jgi:hypothetical protein
VIRLLARRQELLVGISGNSVVCSSGIDVDDAKYTVLTAVIDVSGESFTDLAAEARAAFARQ